MTVDEASSLTSTRRRLVFDMFNRPDLQGMRAVAVLAVFSDHLFGWPSGGFVGVDVFFVLSGFFISGLLLRERAATRRLSFANFYARRAKRILPSALLVLGFTALSAHFLFPAYRARETLLDALWAAVFAANLRFESVGADYFQQGQPPSPIQHYWSLSIEEQFYFVWPALLVALFALTRAVRRRGNARHLVLFATMTVIVISSFSWSMYLSVTDPNAAYFSTFTRVWELGIGAVLAIGGPWLSRLPSKVRPILAYFGLTGVVGSLFVIDSTVLFPAPWAALPVLSTAAVVASFHGVPVRGMLPLTNPVARYFGDTSYTLYLWHWPVITLLPTLTGSKSLFYVLAIVLTLGLTAITYRYYENPIRQSEWLTVGAEHSWLLGRAVWTVAGGLAAAIVIVSIASVRHAEMVSAAQGEPASQVDRTEAVDLDVVVNPCFGSRAMVREGCSLRSPGSFLRPSVDALSQDTQGAFDCYLKRESDRRTLRTCEYGYKGDDAVRIALVGDSHAASLLPALRPILMANKWRLTTYLGQSCNLMFELSPVCKEPMNQVIAELVAHPYDLVVTTSLIGGQAPADYSAAWKQIIDAGNRIAIIADNPTSSEGALACVTRVNFGPDQIGECGTPRTEAVRPDPLVAAAQLTQRATLIDLTRYFCTEDWCPSVIGDVIVYRDYVDGNSHITATFAESLSSAVEDGLKAALSVPPPP
ncbi:acyltransferase family protein [Mycobacterium sp. WMMD1722]|uniref:acyltransferase family protein n=1 Tax=Mycobacterium sp. WMMD1722 TaxID=3404117 RepID=UPI003BF5FED4